MPHVPASQALQRFRVIDLTQVRAGPTCCRQLADWGADVVQVQMPEHMRGDDTLGGQDGSDYQYTHRNKRSITLNLKEPEGIATLKRLIARADVVVENFRPDVKFRLGIDHETLARDNPRLVYASISGFGQTGPLAARPGFDQIAQGMGGLMSVTGLPGDGPMRVGIPIADLCAGIFAAQGILVALLEREVSGQGQFLHTSLLESMVYMMDFQTSRYLIDGEVAVQAGNYHPTSIPTGVYKARDGYMNIAVFGSKIWERFCSILGAPEWITDERYHDKPARSVNRDALNAEINRRLAAQDRAYWVRQFNEGGVACGLINDMREVFEEPQVQHLRMVKEVVSQWQGAQRLVGQPVQLERTPSTIARAAPRRGEHTEEILLELGFAGDDLARMKADGVY
ncbi:CaiB/BaiF CoA transferase family protein [Ramlibacter tataouinensis]|uniref:Formyl-CoA transferase (Formyl-CoA oxalate CoA-transferase)-like protein n=1 Tax=Ramlibacter tataouinensis (strain ATCC BAA-407 / DSM 14655 / LMG 21543 / TTB310) TaxID=365046 RepID=F5XWA7_RAMTT|nr:CaiB/BaiF CoA-transferase family protein [Ramlibacter tataouinensis]AEG91677.1 Formyl-CoA transferase (Formyl-CoA oxalate CoA-transferase)-like protein [Ramlibacter tataouinensis TTB310]